jgi:lysine 6-dehydrogenase
MVKVAVLGCGMIGSSIVEDLAGDSRLQVTAVDNREDNLSGLHGATNITRQLADLHDADAVRSLVAEADLIVGAVPGFMGFSVLRSVIESGRDYVDISFMSEDYFALDELAKERGIAVCVDCGLAPGLANMLVGACHAQLDRTERVQYYVGGLPKTRRWPYEYRATFSPADVLEEYTRPARTMERGRLVTKPALSDPERIDFERVGTLEAFNTDGLRSLLRSIPAQEMREKTLRYPGHRELMEILRETGFLRTDEIELGGVKVVPRIMTGKLLFPHWRLRAGEEDFTLLRVIVEGFKGGAAIRHSYELYDEFDRASGRTSMARTTAFPCAIVARLVLDGAIGAKGIVPPETIGANSRLMQQILEGLAERGIQLRHETGNAESWD